MELIYIVPAPNVGWKSSQSMWIVTHYVTLLVCQGIHDFCSSHFWSDCLTSLGNIVPWMVIYAAELWFDRNPSKLVCNGRKEKLIKWTSKADGPWKDIPFSLQREQRPQTFSEDVNGIQSLNANRNRGRSETLVDYAPSEYHRRLKFTLVSLLHRIYNPARFWGILSTHSSTVV